MGTVNINNTQARPDPAPISKGNNPNNTTIVFQTSDNDTRYTLSGMSSVLNGPDPVTIWKGNNSGTYTAKPDAPATGTYSIEITGAYEKNVGGGSAQIQVDP